MWTHRHTVVRKRGWGTLRLAGDLDTSHAPARNHLCNQPAASNPPNLKVKVDPRKLIAKLLDAPVYKQIFWYATAAVGQLGQTPAIKQVVQPDFVVEPAAHLIVCD